MSIGWHESPAMESDEWLTPPHIVRSLGEFDLDPCSPIKRPLDTARSHMTILDDGLNKEWVGRVWCNPPYGTKAGKWMDRLALHGNGIALIFARTETQMFFQSVWPKATALLFLEGRLKFHRVDGSLPKSPAGAASVLVAYGETNAKSLHESAIRGYYIRINWNGESNA